MAEPPSPPVLPDKADTSRARASDRKEQDSVITTSGNAVIVPQFSTNPKGQPVGPVVFGNHDADATVFWKAWFFGKYS